MELFVLSILILAVGPVIYRLVRERASAIACLDGLIFVSMIGLVFLGVLPETLKSGGLLSAAFLLLGAAIPTIIERHFHGLGRTSHNLSLVLGLTGLCLHAVLDGAGLIATEIGHEAGAYGGHSHLSQAIILHRLPVGLTVWWLLRPAYGSLVAAGVLGLLAAATGLGFFWSQQVTNLLGGQSVAWFQAFVAGSLLHVVFHRPALVNQKDSCCGTESPAVEPCCGETTARAPQHDSSSHSTADTPSATAAEGLPAGDRDHGHGHSHASDSATGATRSTSLWEGIGGVVGLLLLAGLLYEGGEDVADGEHSAHFFESFLQLAFISAPALLLAYTMAGLMNAFLPRSSIQWMGKGGPWSQSLRGMTIGLPFPICSCGVVPLFRTLVKRGAPPAAALGFLVATPELGVDAVLLSFPLLGIKMTVVRVVAAALVAFFVGALLGRVTTGPAVRADERGLDDESTTTRSPGERLRSGLKLSFGEGLDNTAPWILLGLVVAAFLGPVLESGWLNQKIPAAVQVPLFALIGIPMYVCASGATPLVAVLLAGGVSPGAGLAFLLTGPATNITTFGVLAGVYGRAAAVRFSAAMIVLPIASGYLTDLIVKDMTIEAVSHLHEHSATALQQVALAILAIAVLQSFVRNGPRRFLAEVTRV
jgi:uncharacterized membrane protein YraQ (UPF0718 family)